MPRKLKIALCSCGSNRRYVAKVKTVLGENLFFVRCPYCKEETGSFLDREEAIEWWNYNHQKAVKQDEQKGT